MLGIGCEVGPQAWLYSACTFRTHNSWILALCRHGPSSCKQQVAPRNRRCLPSRSAVKHTRHRCVLAAHVALRRLVCVACKARAST